MCHGRASLRLAALLGAAALLSAETCEDNLGDNEPRPVTFRLSVGPQNLQANNLADDTWTTPDGRNVAFASYATNLTPNASGLKEIFVRDRQLDQVYNISSLNEAPDQASIADCERPAISANAQFVAFESKGVLAGASVGSGGPQTTANIYLRDRLTRGLVRVLDGAWPTADFSLPSLSFSGRYLAFQTNHRFAGITYPGVVTATYLQVYVADMFAIPPTITLVSRAVSGPTDASNSFAGEPMISADGQFVVFSSNATDLSPDSGAPAIREIFRATLDLSGGTPVVTGMQLVSRLSGLGARADALCARPTVSDGGRFVSYTSRAVNLGGADPSVYLTDMTANTTTLVGERVFLVEFFIPLVGLISIAERTGLSDDGRLVSYTTSQNKPPTDVILRDMQGGSLTVSLNPVGAPGNSFSGASTISGDGRWVIFASAADNLVVGDTNGVTDVFGHGPLR